MNTRLFALTPPVQGSNNVPSSSLARVHHQDTQIAPISRPSGVEYIDAEYEEINDGATSTVHTDTSSSFIMANQTAYSKYQEITSYNQRAMFIADAAEYNNPYTDSKKDSCLAQIRGTRPRDTFA
ncbi:MAG: hypothetical protein HQM16_01295 [Deltaproteobacteria bacterium]|nr:hypothetical protein [Deltaproteobacteria bacterium]